VKDSHLPRLSFGIIVLNGEPFTRYCLRALYPFAHEIIVVEGAVKAAANLATPEGHSTDGTLETLSRFKVQEDPEDKVQIITREGFWSEKDEQSRAYANRSTGDYLWQVDIDEFYDPRDMRTVLTMLGEDPEITSVSFKQITFWGGFDYVVDGWYLRRGSEIYHRLFKWGPGYQYVTHRPPTVHDSRGRDLRRVRWINGRELAKKNVFLYHYSLLFPKQVMEKCEYYDRVNWLERKEAQRWASEVFLGLRSPFRVHNVYTIPSWLERFHGDHPPQIVALCDDIKAGRINVQIRSTDDIERLLNSRNYRLGRYVIKSLTPCDRLGNSLRRLMTCGLAYLSRRRWDSKNEGCPP
jgi:hypothetical protein